MCGCVSEELQGAEERSVTAEKVWVGVGVDVWMFGCKCGRVGEELQGPEERTVKAEKVCVGVVVCVHVSVCSCVECVWL